MSYLKALHNVGLVRVSGWTKRGAARGRPAAVWAWQRRPFELDDVEPPFATKD